MSPLTAPDPWPPAGRRRAAALFGCLFLLVLTAALVYLLAFGLPHPFRPRPEVLPVSPLHDVRSLSGPPATAPLPRAQEVSGSAVAAPFARPPVAR